MLSESKKKIKKEVKKKKTLGTKWKLKHNTTKLLGLIKWSLKMEIYSYNAYIKKVEKAQTNDIMV